MGVKQNFHAYVSCKLDILELDKLALIAADKTISLGKKPTSKIMLITYTN